MSSEEKSLHRPRTDLLGSQNSMAARPHGLPVPTPQEEWQALGMAFDGLCKVGLALTVGFGVAATFCKLMESGKIKVPAGTLNAVARQVLAANLPTEESHFPPAAPPRDPASPPDKT